MAKILFPVSPNENDEFSHGDKFWVFKSGAWKLKYGPHDIINAKTGYKINNTNATLGHYLRGDGTKFISSQLNIDDFSGTLTALRGGTGVSSPAVGGILRTEGANAMSVLSPTANNMFLQSTGANVFSWALVDIDDFVTDHSITNLKIRQSIAYSVMGRAGSGTGVIADISAGENSVLRRLGAGNLEFGQIGENHISDNAVTTNKISNSNVTLAKIQNISANRLLGNNTGSTGPVLQLSDANIKTWLGLKSAAYIDAGLTGVKLIELGNITGTRFLKIVDNTVSAEDQATFAVSLNVGRLSTTNEWLATQTITGNLILGTQANKATIEYTHNLARTFSLPSVTSGTRTFAIREVSQTFTGDQTIVGNLILGTQTNKATIGYAINQARTLTIPTLAGNRTFSFIDQAEDLSGQKRFNANILLGHASAKITFESITGAKVIETGGTTDLLLSPGGGVAVNKASVTSGFLFDVYGKGLVVQSGNDAQLRNIQVVTELPGSPTAGQIYIVTAS